LRRTEKEIFITEMNERLKRAQASFLVEYQGLNVEGMNKVRKELRQIDAELYVVKNRLLKLACINTDTESIKEHFVGQNALAISYDDMVKPAKVLIGLCKGLEKLKIKVGQISGKPMDLDGVKRLAELPGREELLAQVLSAMQSVSTSLVRVLNGIMIKLLGVLKAIETKKNDMGTS
jgi:large subunit ribosomal protein L10